MASSSKPTTLPKTKFITTEMARKLCSDNFQTTHPNSLSSSSSISSSSEDEADVHNNNILVSTNSSDDEADVHYNNILVSTSSSDDEADVHNNNILVSTSSSDDEADVHNNNILVSTNSSNDETDVHNNNILASTSSFDDEADVHNNNIQASTSSSVGEGKQSGPGAKRQKSSPGASSSSVTVSSSSNSEWNLISNTANVKTVNTCRFLPKDGCQHGVSETIGLEQQSILFGGQKALLTDDDADVIVISVNDYAKQKIAVTTSAIQEVMFQQME